MKATCFCGGVLLPSINPRADIDNMIDYFTLYYHQCNKCPATTMTSSDKKKSKESMDKSIEKYGEYSV